MKTNGPWDSAAWDIPSTAAWIGETCNHATSPVSVCLQLPDQLLEYAAELSEALRSELQSTLPDFNADVYILADTTYNSLSVDEVASAHVDADCVVHYGRASLSKTTGRVPIYYVFPREDHYRYDGTTRLDLGTPTSSAKITVFVDQVFKHAFDEVCAYIRDELMKGLDVTFPALIGVEGMSSVGGYAVVNGIDRMRGEEEPDDLDDPDDPDDPDDVFVWYGASDAPARDHLMLTFNARMWMSIDPINGTVEHGLPLKTRQTLRKRYFLVEKARQANIVGLVVGTLAAGGYKESLDALRTAAAKADKKTYTLLVGKPSPAKLANFPEIDVFVLVADPQGMILDSKEYYAPIITPWEAMVAFSGDDRAWDHTKFSLELVVGLEGDDGDAVRDGGNDMQLVLQAQQALQVANISGSRKDIVASSSAEYLVHKRTWKGVESGRGPEGKVAPSLIEIGRRGRAAGFANEGCNS